MKVAIHQFKARLSGYIAQARAGEVIELTSHDKPVARLVGIAANEVSGIDRLLALGKASWRGGKPALQPAVALGDSGVKVSTMVLEDRR